MEQMPLLAHDIIMKAIKEKTECYIHVNSSSKRGFSLYNYQDRMGIRTRLELYSPNYSDLDGTMGLRWLYVPHNAPEVEGGSMFIAWDNITNISIRKNGDRYLIEIDGLVINFLE